MRRRTSWGVVSLLLLTYAHAAGAAESAQGSSIRSDSATLRRLAQGFRAAEPLIAQSIESALRKSGS